LGLSPVGGNSENGVLRLSPVRGKHDDKKFMKMEKRSFLASPGRWFITRVHVQPSTSR
jgi:hypothetical protein